MATRPLGAAEQIVHTCAELQRKVLSTVDMDHKCTTQTRHERGKKRDIYILYCMIDALKFVSVVSEQLKKKL